jgi:hypothetical protein
VAIAMLSVAGTVALLGRGTPSPLGDSASGPADSASPAAIFPTAGEAQSGTTLAIPGLTLALPAGWQVVLSHIWDSRGGPRAFLSDAAIADPCPTSVMNDLACWEPLSVIPPGRMLVTVDAIETGHLPAPEPTIRTLAPDSICAALKGDATLTAVFRGFALNACAREPALEVAAATFRAIVDSTSVAATSAAPVSLPPGISRDAAIALARDHARPDDSFVEAAAGRFSDLDANPSGTGPGSPIKPTDPVWAITYRGEVTVCPPGGPACESPRPGYLVVYLDYRTGSFLMSEGVSPAP